MGNTGERILTEDEIVELIKKSEKIPRENAVLCGCTKAKDEHYGISIADYTWDADKAFKVINDSPGIEGPEMLHETVIMLLTKFKLGGGEGVVHKGDEDYLCWMVKL